MSTHTQSSTRDRRIIAHSLRKICVSTKSSISQLEGIINFTIRANGHSSSSSQMSFITQKLSNWQLVEQSTTYALSVPIARLLDCSRVAPSTCFLRTLDALRELQVMFVRVSHANNALGICNVCVLINTQTDCFVYINFLLFNMGTFSMMRERC